MRRPILVLAFCAALHAQPSFAQKQELTIDLGSDAATLDPQVQWDTDSYSVYRNIFDNLLTRDPSGKIVYPGFPADDLFLFRFYSFAAQLILWTVIGLGFATLAPRLFGRDTNPAPVVASAA